MGSAERTVTQMDEVRLTKGEAESLLDFLEMNLIDSIRNDPDCDNIKYIENLIRIWRKCGGHRVDDEDGDT